MFIRLKKISISLLMAIVIAIINDNPNSVGLSWIFFYIIASIFQAIGIENNRPHYKKVLLNNLWITAIFLALLLIYILSFPQAASIKFELDFTNGAVVFFVSLSGYLMGYAINAITGLLTVFWLTWGKNKT